MIISNICKIPNPNHRPREPPKSDKKDVQLKGGKYMLFLVTDGRKLTTILDEFVLLPIDWIFTPIIFVAKHGFLENQGLGLV